MISSPDFSRKMPEMYTSSIGKCEFVTSAVSPETKKSVYFSHQKRKTRSSGGVIYARQLSIVSMCVGLSFEGLEPSDKTD